MNDPEEYNLEEGDPETIKSGLFIRSIGANFLYVFNDQYSLEAAFQQTKRQLKWEWSFLLMTSLNYYQIANNGSLIPISEASEYGDEAGYQGGRYASLTLAPGIGIIVPFYMFYFTGSIYVGAGIMNKRKKINGDNYKENGSCQKANIKFGLGFNSDKSYFGIFTLWDYIDTNGRFSDNIGANAGVSAGYIGWNAGLRF